MSYNLKRASFSDSSRPESTRPIECSRRTISAFEQVHNSLQFRLFWGCPQTRINTAFLESINKSSMRKTVVYYIDVVQIQRIVSVIVMLRIVFCLMNTIMICCPSGQKTAAGIHPPPLCSLSSIPASSLQSPAAVPLSASRNPSSVCCSSVDCCFLSNAPAIVKRNLAALTSP